MILDGKIGYQYILKDLFMLPFAVMQPVPLFSFLPASCWMLKMTWSDFFSIFQIMLKYVPNVSTV